MKVFSPLLLFVFASISICSAQMQPSDSLLGTYSGQYWYANPATSPWVITPDTLFVDAIDTVNCIVHEFDIHFNGNYSLYTDYFSCNSPAPSNAYTKFYSFDSVRVITDNYPQPPPNPPFSFRFYGKRISNKTIGINELLSSEQVRVFPNPTSDVLNIELERKINGQVQLIDLMGRKIRNERLTASKTQIDVRDLKEGIYFVQIQTEQGVIAKKIVVQH